MSDAIEAYRRLRDRVDQMSESLTKIHGGQMVCKAGCCGCCVDLTVFPVEFYSIAQELGERGVPSPTFDPSLKCGFLDASGLCRMYPYRPLICRTQGLPLAFLNEDVSPVEMNVTFCEKNFAEPQSEVMDFGPENTLNLDTINDSLWRIHLAFLEEHPELHLEPSHRIELKRLAGQVK